MKNFYFLIVLSVSTSSFVSASQLSSVVQTTSDATQKAIQHIQDNPGVYVSGVAGLALPFTGPLYQALVLGTAAAYAASIYQAEGWNALSSKAASKIPEFSAFAVGYIVGSLMNDYRNQVAYAQQQARFQKKMNEFEVQRVEIRALTDERNELADAQNKVNDLPESK